MILLESRMLGIFRLTIEDQLSTLQFNDTTAVNLILEDMMRSNSTTNETSVSVTIAQYLLENSPTFKELTGLRQKVFENELRHQELCLHAFGVGRLLRATGISKIVVHNPTMPIESRRRASST